VIQVLFENTILDMMEQDLPPFTPKIACISPISKEVTG
jgi:hypothetical protein